MRTLSALIVFGLIGGAAGYLVPMPPSSDPGLHTSQTAASADPLPAPGESAHRLIAGILASDALHEQCSQEQVIAQSTNGL